MADYYNPSNFNPGNDYKPNGFLGGYTWAEDRRRYDDLMEIFKSNQQMQQQENASKLEALLAEQPYKTQETIAKAKANAQFAPRGIEGENQNKWNESQLGLQTLPGRIGATNSTNEATVRTNALKKHQDEQALYDEAIARLAMTPPGIEQQTILSNPMYQTLPGWENIQRDPQRAAQLLPVIKQIKQHNWEQSKEGMKAAADYTQHTDTAQIGATGRERAAGITAAASERNAALMADSRLEAARMRMEEAEQKRQQVKNWEQAAERYSREAQAEKDPNKKLQLEEMYRFAQTNAERIRQAAGMQQQGITSRFTDRVPPPSAPAGVPRPQGPQKPVTFQPASGGPPYIFPNQAALDAYKAAGGR